jgi:hypothetical protein
VVGVGVAEALHPEQVRAGEAALAGKGALDCLGHADDHAITVCAGSNAPRDASAEFPVELDKRAGDCTTRADTRGLDQRDCVCERVLGVRQGMRFPGWHAVIIRVLRFGRPDAAETPRLPTK